MTAENTEGGRAGGLDSIRLVCRRKYIMISEGGASAVDGADSDLDDMASRVGAAPALDEGEAAAEELGAEEEGHGEQDGRRAGEVERAEYLPGHGPLRWEGIAARADSEPTRSRLGAGPGSESGRLSAPNICRETSKPFRRAGTLAGAGLVFLANDEGSEP